MGREEEILRTLGIKPGKPKRKKKATRKKKAKKKARRNPRKRKKLPGACTKGCPRGCKGYDPAHLARGQCIVLTIKDYQHVRCRSRARKGKDHCAKHETEIFGGGVRRKKRCEAKTKQGKRCKKASVDVSRWSGLSLCGTHY